MPVEDRIERLLASSPDRNTAARFLRRLRAERLSGFETIVNSGAALRAAVAIFSHSAFLSEAVLRDPHRMVEVVASDRFYRALSVDEYEELLEEFDGSFAA